MTEAKHIIEISSIHDHPLSLTKIHKDISDQCGFCKELLEIEGTTVWVYQCTVPACNFFMHKSCAEFETRCRYLQHVDENQYPYIECEFDEESSSTRKLCPYCSKTITKGEVVYGIRECKYFLHKSCVDSFFDQTQIQIGDKTAIDHPFCHHPMFLYETVVDDSTYGCKICSLHVEEASAAYGCLMCKFYMHKHCAELSVKPIKSHPFHPQHLLIPYMDTGRCNACFRFGHVFLGCKSCYFFLHVGCPSLEPILKVIHKSHPIFLLEKRFIKDDPHHNTSIKCSTCYEFHQLDDLIFKCMYPVCKDYFHVSCAPFDLPKPVNFYQQQQLKNPLITFVTERDASGCAYRCIELDGNSEGFTSKDPITKREKSLAERNAEITKSTDADGSARFRTQQKHYEDQTRSSGWMFIFFVLAVLGMSLLVPSLLAYVCVFKLVDSY